MAERRIPDSPLLLVGDSIIESWLVEGLTVWQRHIEPYAATNFGFSGDRTFHTLWRLQQSAAQELQPSLIFCMIGTNNVEEGHRPEEISAGIHAVESALHEMYAGAEVYIILPLPRGSAGSPERMTLQAVRALGAEDVAVSGLRRLDFWPYFLSENGELEAGFFRDGLHLTELGYLRLWECLEPIMEAGLKR